MRDHGYDLRYYMENNWATIGPKLVGKLHIYCGDMDNFYLNLAVYKLEDFLNRTSNPPYGGSFEYGRPMKGHGWTPLEPGAAADRDGQPHHAERARRGGWYVEVLERFAKGGRCARINSRKTTAAKMACRVARRALIAAGVFLTAFMAAGMACAQTLQPGSPLPQIKGTSLDDQEITLPDVAAGKETLLIITFSKAAGERARSWNDPFFKDYPQDDKVTSYAIAMLEDVPGLLRGMVRGGIRRGVPAPMRRRFLTVIKGEAEWRKHAGVQDDKDAYLLSAGWQGPCAVDAPRTI